MARNSNSGSTDTASDAQKRFVVSLPAEVGTQVDEVGAKLAKALQAETGIAFELSRAQIIQALVRQALAEKPSEEPTEETPAEEPATA